MNPSQMFDEPELPRDPCRDCGQLKTLDGQGRCAGCAVRRETSEEFESVLHAEVWANHAAITDLDPEGSGGQECPKCGTRYLLEFYTACPRCAAAPAPEPEPETDQAQYATNDNFYDEYAQWFFGDCPDFPDGVPPVSDVTPEPEQDEAQPDNSSDWLTAATDAELSAQVTDSRDYPGFDDYDDDDDEAWFEDEREWSDGLWYRHYDDESEDEELIGASGPDEAEIGYEEDATAPSDDKDIPW